MIFWNTYEYNDYWIIESKKRRALKGSYI